MDYSSGNRTNDGLQRRSPDSEWVIILQPDVSPRESVASFETHEPSPYERCWIKGDRITRSDAAIGDRGYKRDSIRIYQKEMDAPAAFWVRLHMVEELPVASVDQIHLKATSIGPDAEVLASPSMAKTTAVEIGGQVLFENPPYQVSPRKFDGDEVGEEKIGKRREIVDHASIYPVGHETLFQKYISGGFGSDWEAFLNRCYPSRCQASVRLARSVLDDVACGADIRPIA
jgi:hypothetical protein